MQSHVDTFDQEGPSLTFGSADKMRPPRPSTSLQNANRMPTSNNPEANYEQQSDSCDKSKVASFVLVSTLLLALLIVISHLERVANEKYVLVSACVLATLN